MNSIAPRKRPRPRPVVSCLRCREKKLKCDRTCPCQNCIKAGCRTECTYHTRPHADEPQGCKSKKSRSSSEVDDTNHGPSLRLGTGVVEDLQQRVARLEELLIVRSDVSNSTPVSMARTGESVWVDIVSFSSFLISCACFGLNFQNLANWTNTFRPWLVLSW